MNNRLIPFAYIRFDNSLAGSTEGQIYKTLLVGHKFLREQDETLPNIAEDTAYPISDGDEAAKTFGRGSMLHRMVEKYRLYNRTGEILCLPISDESDYTATSYKLTVTMEGTVQKSILHLYLGEDKLEIPVETDDTREVLVSRILSKVNERKDLLFFAEKVEGDEGSILFTFKHKGSFGNYVRVEKNARPGERDPIGVAVNIEKSLGSGDHKITGDIAKNIRDLEFNFLVFPYGDTLKENYSGEIGNDLISLLQERWSEDLQLDGVVIVGDNSDLTVSANAEKIKKRALSLNQYNICLETFEATQTPIFEALAAKAGVLAAEAQLDPARPFQTLPVIGIMPPKPEKRLKKAQREGLLRAGISTNPVGIDGKIRVEVTVTTQTRGGNGANDNSYRYLNTVLILSRLRYDLRNFLLRKYPRHKLADDGTQFAPGQPIVTPGMIKSAIVGLARDWENNGLVENVDAFINALIVRRPKENPNVIDIRLRPDLINQMRIFGATIQFLN